MRHAVRRSEESRSCTDLMATPNKDMIIRLVSFRKNKTTIRFNKFQTNAVNSKNTKFSLKCQVTKFNSKLLSSFQRWYLASECPRPFPAKYRHFYPSPSSAQVKRNHWKAMQFCIFNHKMDFGTCNWTQRALEYCPFSFTIRQISEM